MSFPISDALTLIRSAILLLKDDPLILASPEDAAYFRMKRDKPATAIPSSPAVVSKIEKKKPTIEKKEDVEIPQPIIPKALVQAAAPPKPPIVEQTTPEIKPELKTKERPSSQLRAILEKIAPELAILDAIPDDTTAKQIGNRWKTKNQSAPISILSSGELPQHKEFLSEIATALDVCFGPARFVEADPLEKEKQWKLFLSTEGLKLIVVCDSTLWQLHQLRQFYKETPATGERMLSNVPIFLLPDLSLYLKDPPLKRSLWKALCSKLS